MTRGTQKEDKKEMKGNGAMHNHKSAATCITT
jgi:hypothetical protein